MAPPPSQADNDPVTATYSVYLAPPPPKENPPRSILIQYPDRSGRLSYGFSNHETPVAFRLKPKTGLVELDIPLDTAHNYNRARGNEYAEALHRSRILAAGGSHGLAGGFNTGPGSRVYRHDNEGDVDMATIPQYGNEAYRELKTQTLGGKIAKPSDGDPIYMLGAFRGAELHLTSLDSLVQVRTQLHHLDAAEEVARGASKTAKKGEQPEKPSGPETRAVELKVKTAEEKNADRSRKRTNAEMLSNIQSEPWETYHWHDITAQKQISHITKNMYHSHDPNSTEEPPLTSAITPTAYLDAISAPRIDLTNQSIPNTTSRSHLGLMGKVRGRERERRRRKKNDADRKAAAAEAEEAARRSTAEAVERGEMGTEEAEEIIRQASEEAAGAADESTDESSGSSSEDEDAAGDGIGGAAAVDTGGEAASHDDVEVKTQQAAKRGRGRPKKEAKPEAMIIDD